MAKTLSASYTKYVIHTSDGKTWAVSCDERAMEIVDMYGPEVVSIVDAKTGQPVQI